VLNDARPDMARPDQGRCEDATGITLAAEVFGQTKCIEKFVTKRERGGIPFEFLKVGRQFALGESSSSTPGEKGKKGEGEHLKG